MKVADESICKVILLAGPSGSGKGRLAKSSKLPTLNLDDFYREYFEPDLPQAFGIVDWDDPASWNQAQALAALENICRNGSANIPIYSIAQSQKIGSRRFAVTDSKYLLAEGIFAAQMVRPLTESNLLAAALVLDRNPALVFWLRFIRDLKESRKPIHTLIVRGLALAKQQRGYVDQLAKLGMQRVNLRTAKKLLNSLEA